MSKTIEFIEKEIESCRLKINKAKEEKLYRETIALIFPENKNINLTTVNEIERPLNEYKIKYLQQIKCELEAWQAVKKHLEVFEEDYWNGIPVEEITMTSKIYRKDYPIIKKALEVEDE
jgi:hypothetical protein